MSWLEKPIIHVSPRAHQHQGPHITPNEEMEERDKHQEIRETKRGGEKEMDVAPVTIQQVFFHLIPLYKREVPVKTLTADL